MHTVKFNETFKLSSTSLTKEHAEKISNVLNKLKMCHSNEDMFTMLNPKVLQTWTPGEYVVEVETTPQYCTEINQIINDTIANTNV